MVLLLFTQPTNVLCVAFGDRTRRFYQEYRPTRFQETTNTSPFAERYIHSRRTAAMLAFHAIWKVLLAFGWSTITSHLSNCEPVRGPTDSNVDEDYDIHVPLSALPLGVNVGPSLEILSFRSDQETGELPWIAHRGWLAVGDVLVSLEGEDISAVGITAVLYWFPCPPPSARASRSIFEYFVRR